MNTLINGRAYDWSMIEFAFGFTTDVIPGITAIKWEIDEDVKPNYGVGNKPISRGFGNITYDASITLDYTTQVALQEISPDRTLRGLGEFDIIVQLSHPDDSRTVSTTIKGCVFSQSGMDVSQGDTNITKEFKLNPALIVELD
ncbi:MAG: hypothetical protein ACRDD8_05955 [Bacteroidales bacterium]